MERNMRRLLRAFTFVTVLLAGALAARMHRVVSNTPQFQKAFSCKPDAPMVKQNACRVW